MSKIKIKKRDLLKLINEEVSKMKEEGLDERELEQEARWSAWDSARGQAGAPGFPAKQSPQGAQDPEIKSDFDPSAAAPGYDAKSDEFLSWITDDSLAMDDAQQLRDLRTGVRVSKHLNGILGRIAMKIHQSDTTKNPEMKEAVVHLRRAYQIIQQHRKSSKQDQLSGFQQDTPQPSDVDRARMKPSGTRGMVKSRGGMGNPASMQEELEQYITDALLEELS